MSNRLFAAITVMLPDEALPQATEIQRITTAWATFLQSMKELQMEPVLSIAPVDEPPKRRRRKKATSGPRLAAVGSHPPDTAA